MQPGHDQAPSSYTRIYLRAVTSREKAFLTSIRVIFTISAPAGSYNSVIFVFEIEPVTSLPGTPYLDARHPQQVPAQGRICQLRQSLSLCHANRQWLFPVEAQTIQKTRTRLQPAHTMQRYAFHRFRHRSRCCPGLLRVCGTGVAGRQSSIDRGVGDN